MRITTADHEDATFWRNHFNNPEIYLDNVAVEHVVWADTDTGEVRVVDYDEGGRPRYAGGRYIHKTLTGTVRIEEKKETV